MSDTYDVVYPDFSPDDAYATFGLARYLRFNAKNFPANNFTITFWVQPSDSGTLLFYGSPDNGTMFNSLTTTMEIRQNGATLEIDFRSASQNSTTVVVGNFEKVPHFVAIRFSQVADMAKIHVNIDNVQVDPVSVQLINSEQNAMTLQAGDMLFVGTRTPDSEGHTSLNDVYTGIITDLRVWKHVMTEAEILEDSFREVYGDEQDLVLALPLDADNINIDINTADNLVGDISDDPQFSFVSDQPGWVMVDQFPMPAGTMTIEWWMRCGVNDYGYLLNYDDISNSDHPNDASNNLIISYSGGVQINNRATGINFTDGEWHHIALVFTDTTEAYFLDGFQVGSTQQRSFDSLLTPRRLVMGTKSLDVIDNAFSGQMQRFIVWNTALSADSVLDRALLADITDSQKLNIAAAIPLTTAIISNLPSVSYSSSPGLLFKKDIQPLSDGINWFRDQKITSRTTLTDDFVLNDAGTVITQSVYRIIVKCSSLAQLIKISALDPVTISINDGQPVVVDSTKVAQVELNSLGKVQISFPATDIRCPVIRLQTDLMDSSVYHYVFPDIEVHKKIAQMPANTLAKDETRTALGIDPNLTNAQLNNFQTALQNISSTVQHTYNRTKHSVTRDRKILPINMKDTHFKFEFQQASTKTFEYTPLSKDQVSTEVGSAQKVNTIAQQGFFADAIEKLHQAEAIVIHTIQNIEGVIADGIDQTKKDIVGSVQQIGEDISHGDILYAAQDLIRGGENISQDLVRTSAGVVTSAVQGGGQLFAITLKLGQDMYQYFISHTGDVGRIISALFQKIASTVDKVIDWIKDKLPVTDILHTYNVLLDYFNTGFVNSTTALNSLKTNLNDYIDGLTVGLQSHVDEMMKGYTLAPASNTKDVHPGHSSAMEKVEWLIGKIQRSTGSLSALPLPAATSTQNNTIDAIYNAFIQKFGNDGSEMIKLFDKSLITDFFTLIASGTNAAGYIISAFWKLVQSLISAGMTLLKTIVDKIIDLVLDMLAKLKEALQTATDLGFVNSIYTFFTGDNSMTIMKLSTLLIAIPLTILSKNATGSVPFPPPPPQDNELETRLLTTPLSSDVTAYGTIYGILHIGLAPLAIIGDIKSIVSVAGDNTISSTALSTWVNKFNTNTLKTPAYSDSVLTTINAFLSIGAQFIGNPVPPNKPYALPVFAERDDPKLAPNFYAHVVWIYQWFGWGGHYVPSFINLGLYNYKYAQGWFTTVIPAFDVLFGAFHVYLMAALDKADRGRITELCIAKDAGNSLTTDETNYLNWATQDNTLQIWNSQTRTLSIPVSSPLARKTFGNICDCIPELSQLGVHPNIVKWTKGYSLLGTIFLDTFGQVGEGATVIVRTLNNELY